MSETESKVLWVTAQYAAIQPKRVGDLWRVAEVTGQGSLRLELVDGGAERVEFIRRQVIALAASDAPSPEAAWAAARRTWDAKPEDC
jgi:hypothetical protein